MSAAAKIVTPLTPPQQTKTMVGAPDFVVIVRGAGSKPEVIPDAAMVAVSGGIRFAGNGYVSGERFGKRFTFGINAPGVIGVVTKSGQKRSIADATKVLFCGGVDPAKTPTRAPAPARVSFRGPSVDISDMSSGSTDIIDERDEVHLVDNGASMEMADRFVGGMTDFDETVKARNEAMQAADGDDLTAHVIMQQSTQQDLVTQAPWMRTTPPSALKGILGSTATVKAGGPLSTVCYWVADSDAETTQVTVTLYNISNIVEQNFTFGDCFPFARVSYGTRDTQVSFEVDIGRGCQFTVAASSVTVEVGMDSPRTGAIAGIMKLQGMLSFGPVYHSPALTRSVAFDVANGNVSSFVVPRFARDLFVAMFDSVAPSPGTGPGYHVEFDPVNGLSYSRNVPAGTYWLAPMPLAGGIVNIQMRPLAGFDISGYLIFGLAI